MFKPKISVLLLCGLSLSACDRLSSLVSDDGRAACTSNDYASPKTMAGCTALIEAKGTMLKWRVIGHYRRSMLRSMSGDQEGAKLDATRAVELDPTSVDALVNRGIVFSANGEQEPALTDLKKAVALDAGNVSARVNLGAVYERAGTPALALEHLDHALSLAPNEPVILGQRCWTLAILDRDLPGALSNCNRAVALMPQDANAYNTRGFVYFRMKDYGVSIADYDKAVLGNPTVASSFYVRGLAKLALGRSAEGDADIAQAFKLEPGVAERYARYGVAPVAKTVL